MSVKIAHLLVDVVAVVALHLEPSIVIVKCTVGHLESLLTYSRNSPQVSLIALVLENGFLPQLDSVFLFEFFDHVLQELEVSPLLVNFSVHFDRNFLFLAFSLHFVTSDLGENFHVAHGSHEQATLVEVGAELLALFYLALLSPRLYHRVEILLKSTLLAPLVNPAQDGLIVLLNLYEKHTL